MSPRPRHRRLRRALLGALLATTAAAPRAAAQSGPDPTIRIQVSPLQRRGRERIAVAPARLPPGRPDPVLVRTAAELEQVLFDDLRWSGVFDMVDRALQAKVPPSSPEKMPYEDWVAVGASWVVLVDLAMAGPELVLEGRLFETKLDRKMVLGKRYQASLDSARKVAHTFADAVIGQVGGEPGACTTQIAFVSDRDGGRDREIYVADYDGHAPRRVTSNRRLNLSPDWGPGNERIAYTSFLRGNPDLYLLARGSGKNVPLFNRPGMNSSPAWSPDGRVLAFASSHEGGDSEIYLIQPDGSGLRRLTQNRGIDTNPAWSPNGREIAFTSDRSGKPHVWVMDEDGLNPRKVTSQGQFNDGAAYAPAGRNTRMAFAGMTGGQFQIFVLTIETGELVQLTDTGSNEAPSWSPDGRQIAFASTRGGRTDVYVMNDDGGNLRRITSGGNNVSPDWSHRP